MGAFFSQFPKVNYDIIGDSSFVTLTDFTKNVDVNDELLVDSAYTFYDILDGERPDNVSYKLYGTTNYYWTFFILNNDMRKGLNFSWPLSSNQLEKMFEKEYDKYSVITFLPKDVKDITGLNQSGLMQLAYLHNEYLPYLRLYNTNKTEFAKILKYDSSLLQLIIYDIKRVSDLNLVTSIKSFINNPIFSIGWVNPFTIDSEEWIKNEALKTEYVSKSLDIYSSFDKSSMVNPSMLTELVSQEQIDANIKNHNETYVFSKTFVSATESYNWLSYRNAASEYFKAGDQFISVSAFDLLSNDNVVSPSYISYYEKEMLQNNKNEKIKVIRKEQISNFATQYFKLLNS